MIDVNSNPVAELQRNVQRLLGRCLLVLQQYERGIKVLLADHEVASAVQELEKQRVERAEKFSGQSLGQLVTALFGTFVVAEGFERDLLPDSKASKDQMSLAFSYRLSMTAENLSETKKAIAEVVELRNGLVHHFLEQFNLWTEDGCNAAAKHLEDCYTRIDRRYLELSGGVKNSSQVREVAAETLHDFLANGIAPDGSVEWPRAGIVRVLNEAHKQCEVHGWARLEDACEWMSRTHPDQVPEKYSCISWPHVLNESKAFDLTYREEMDEPSTAWFRPRPDLA